MRTHQLPALIIAALAGLTLAGCAAMPNISPGEPNEPNTGVSDGTGTTDSDTDDSANSTQKETGLTLPDSFPREVPMLPYELIQVSDRSAGGSWWITMRGTDIVTNGDELRQQMADAGFTEVSWLHHEHMGVGAVYELDNLLVGVKILDTDEGIDIRYDVLKSS
jgi:uncharacterized protein YceK